MVKKNKIPIQQYYIYVFSRKTYTHTKLQKKVWKDNTYLATSHFKGKVVEFGKRQREIRGTLALFE